MRSVLAFLLNGTALALHGLATLLYLVGDVLGEIAEWVLG